MADQSYWVRTEHGRVWGPFTLEKLERLRGQLTEKCEASLDGQIWRAGVEFPELRQLLAPARKIEKQAAPAASPPRISRAIAEAFGIKDAPVDAAGQASAASKPPPAAAPQAPPKARPANSAPPAPAETPQQVPESGALEALSPVRLYALAALTSASGTLRLELEKRRSLRISFRRGTPEHLSSDNPDLSLLRFLHNKGLFSAEKALQAEEAVRGGAEIVSVLFQMQLIAPADAARLLGEHAGFLLDRALLCWRGSFGFEKDALPPPGAFPLGSKWTLLAEAVRRLEVPLLRARLGKRLSRPVVRSGGLGIGKVEELSLNAQEARIYAAIDGTHTGEELLKEHDAAVAVRLLYLLSELGHLSFAGAAEEEQPPPRPPPPAKAAEPPISAPRLPSNAERAMGKPRELPKTTRAAPPSPAAPAAVKSAPPVMQKSAVPQIARAPPAFAQGPAGESPEAQKTRLSALLEKLSAADHFEALGMEQKSATAAEAKRNFFVLAKELHPDTVTDPAQGELKELKERLFARINEAAQVLSDDKRRKEYEDELAGKKDSVDVARIFAAEENFQRAEIMIKARKYKEGLELLENAIEMNANEAEFYAWRGYARFLLSQDRKAVYEETAGDCRRAIKMVEKCLPAHLFLGHMAKIIGDLKLAQKCYHQVLELDPNHIEAQRELRLMGKKG